MRRITITKSKAGHYWLTVRNPDGSLLARQMCDTLTIARRAAAPYRAPSQADYLAALGPCGR
jgi:hypothetical protein